MKRIFLIYLIIFTASQNLYSQNNDAEIIKYETKYKVSADNVLTEDVCITIQINKRSGEKFTNIKILYSEKNPITNLNAQIEDIFGNRIRKLKKKEIIDRSYISNSTLYQDKFIKAFNLKHNVYPYRISYNYRITSKNFFYIADWSPVIYIKTSTKKANLELTIPNNYKILLEEQNIEKSKIDTLGNTIKYSWKSSYTNNYKYNLFSPDITNSISSVKIVPANFIKGEPGNQENWKNFGNWIMSLNEGLELLPNAEKQKIDEVLKGQNTENKKIDALYKYMQKNTRYINVAIDIGGLKPYNATYVSENKYGDCKALTNYMKSILSYAGIKSYYSLIYSGDKIKKINKDFTSSQFNHVVLFVPKKDTTWLECTSKYNPTGYWGTSTQNRYALVIDKDNSKLIKTPKLETTDVEELRTINFSFIHNNAINAEINFLFKGIEYEYFNSFDKILNQDQKNKYVHDLIPFYNYNLGKWKINKNNDEQAELSFYAKIVLKDYIKTYDNIKYISLFPIEIPTFEKPQKRTKDVQIDYPINIKDSLIYQNISGYNIALVKDTSYQSVYGTYYLKSRKTPEGLLITKQFILHPNEIKLSEYKAFYQFIQKIKTTEHKNPIIYTKK